MIEIKDYINRLVVDLESVENLYTELYRIVNLLYDKKSNTIFLCGNGGSSSTASHLANDLLKMCNMKSICLSDNVPLVTAISNDIDYKNIFSYQLDKLAKKGDILWVFSGSGNSKNIIEAIYKAQEIGMKIISFIGCNGGIIHKMKLPYTIYLSTDMQHIEDLHLILGHAITRVLYDKQI